MRLKIKFKKIRFIKWDVLRLFKFSKYKGEKWSLFYYTTLNSQKILLTLLNNTWYRNSQVVKGFFKVDKGSKKNIKKFFLICKKRLKILAPYISNKQIKALCLSALKTSNRLKKPIYNILPLYFLLRLDIVLYLSNLFKTPFSIKNSLSTYNIFVNGKKVTNLSYRLKVGDKITFANLLKQERQFLVLKLWRWHYFLVTFKDFMLGKLAINKKYSYEYESYKTASEIFTKSYILTIKKRQHFHKDFRKNLKKKIIYYYNNISRKPFIFPKFLGIGHDYIYIKPFIDNMCLYQFGIDVSIILRGVISKVSFG